MTRTELRESDETEYIYHNDMNNNVGNFCDNDNETKQVPNTTLADSSTAIRVDVINNDNDYVRQYHGYSCWSQIKQRIHQSQAHYAVWW